MSRQVYPHICHITSCLVRPWSAETQCERGAQVDVDPEGEYIGLVVRLQPRADGRWQVVVDGTHPMPPAPLLPMTLVVRLWQSKSGILRGRIGLHGSPLWAPIQSSRQLTDLARACLLDDGGSGDGD